LTQQLETLKKNAKGNDELTKTIEELQKKNDTIIDQHAGNGVFYTIKII
jgi:hypothetical protein